MSIRRALALCTLALAAACGSGTPTAPWLTYPGMEHHLAWLPLLGTPHDPSAPGTTVRCESCHPGQSFRQFDCIGCHTAAKTDPIHLGVATGYPTPCTSDACYGCHPQGIGLAVDHGKLFPIGTSSHPAVCSTCHGDLADRKNVARLLCAGCHAGRPTFAGKHGAVKDYAAASPDCVRCHADGQVDRVAAHQARFPAVSGSAVHDTACVHCHTTLRTDKPWAADFAAYACTACHLNPATDAAHQGVTGYVYASASCYRCHPDGTGGAPANHTPSFFPIGAGSKHQGVGCSQCHTNRATPNDPSAFACASCHAGLAGFATAHTVTGYGILVVYSGANASTPVAATSANCLRCHADSQVDRIAAHPAGEESFGTPGHRSKGCLTCHGTLRSDKGFGANFRVRTNCTLCHGAGGGG